MKKKFKELKPLDKFTHNGRTYMKTRSFGRDVNTVNIDKMGGGLLMWTDPETEVEVIEEEQ